MQNAHQAPCAEGRRASGHPLWAQLAPCRMRVGPGTWVRAGRASGLPSLPGVCPGAGAASPALRPHATLQYFPLLHCAFAPPPHMPVPDELVLIRPDTAWPPSRLGAFSHAGPLRAKAAPVAQAPAAPSRPWPCWVVVDQVHAVSPRAPWAPVERVCPLPHTPASGPHRGDGLKASGTKCGRLRRGLQGGGETGGPVGRDVDSTDTVHVPIHTKPLGALSPPCYTWGN